MCRWFGQLILNDRSVSHGQYRRSVRLHLRENTVDIDGRSNTHKENFSRYRWLVRLIVSENRSISTFQVDSCQKKLVDSRYRPPKKKSVDRRYRPTNLQKNKKGPILTTLISRSPREGVDTCRDRALNASGRGYYGQANAGRAAKATHGTQVPS